MCMALGYSAPGGGIVATCTRTNLSYVGGEVVPWDLGGKLIQTPSGWAAGTGETAMLFSGLHVLRDIPPDLIANHPSHPREQIESLYDKIAGRIVEILPSSTPAKTAFFLLHKVGADVVLEDIRPDGSGVAYSPESRVMVSWPPAAQGDPTLIDSLLGGSSAGELIGAATSRVGVIRLIASWFAYCAEIDGTMSPEIEMGILETTPTGGLRWLYARALASDLARGTDIQVLRSFKRPEPRPPFPGHEAEQFIFNVAYPDAMISPSEVGVS